MRLLPLLSLWLSLASAATTRDVIPFRYGWRFTSLLAADDGPGPQTCSFADNVTDMECTAMEWNPNRVTEHDCRTGCCYEPTCMVWQQMKTSCMWGSNASVCSKTSTPSGYVGGQRSGPVPSFKTDYAYSAGVSFDDSGWRLVDVPFDSLANGTITDSPDVHHGFFPRNVSWYRKRFTLTDDELKNGALFLEFEGTFHFTQIWINGHFIRDHSIGYTPFSVRLDTLPSSLVQPGVPNVISIRTDASYGSGHWYEGGGIRWDVNLVKYNSVHIPRYGAFVVPQLASGANGVAASVQVVDDSVGSFSAISATTTVVVALSKVSSNEVVASCSGSVDTLPATVNCTLSPQETLQRWTVKHPHLYSVTASLQVNNATVDSVAWTTGFRDAEYSGSKGLSLEGQPITLRGFSHHDSFGGMGVAMPPRFDLFRVQAGKALGHNVWRMSHNPYHPPLYDILDSTGTIVWDENRDMGPWYVEGMRDMVMRDRNHPAIFFWSFCNEYECLQYDNQTGLAFRAAARSADVSRPTTSNVNGGNWITGVDVQGFSHEANASFAAFHADSPDVPMVLSECCSCRSQRLPVSDRGANSACMWQQNSPLLNQDNMGSLGVWTLFDYFGESHSFPNYACAFGQFDIAGTPKPHAYWYTVNWLRMLEASDPGVPTFPASPTASVKNGSHAVYLLDLPDQLSCSAETCTLTAVGTTPQLRLYLNGEKIASSAAAAYPWPTVGAPMTWTVPVSDVLGPAYDTATNCSFPVDLSGDVQCRGLIHNPNATTAEECQQACCDAGSLACNVWQFEEKTQKEHCWMGPIQDFQESCTNGSKVTDWQGSGIPMVNKLASVKVEALDSTGTVVASQTTLGPAGAAPAALRATVDVPSPLTGTGTALVLDGIDAGMVRVQLTTKDGRVVSEQSKSVRVQWSVLSGPGRVMGIGSGDPSAHDYQLGNSVNTFASVARAMIQVTQDCTSPGIASAMVIDGETANVVKSTTCTVEDIVVEARAVLPNGDVVTAKASIPTSSNPETDGFMAVARSKTSLDAYAYLESF